LRIIKRLILIRQKKSTGIWCKENQTFFEFSSSTWSLFFITQLCLRMRKKNSIVIYVPSYICNSALRKIRQKNITIIFYSVNSDLSLNKSDFIENSYILRPDIVLHIHYFGVENEIKFLQDYCDSNDIWLIEDAVHCITPKGKIGELGKFVLYSPHKHFPIPDGAILVVNDHNCLGDDKLQMLNIFNDIFYENIDAQWSSKISNSLWFMKRVLQKIGLVLTLSDERVVEVKKLVKYKKHPFQSFFSKIMLRQEIENIETNINRRMSVQKRINDFFCLVFTDSDIKITNEWLGGYYLTLNCSSATLASKVYGQILRSGLPVLKWPDLPPEVLSRPEKYQNTLNLFHSHVFIQIHQSISDKQLDTCFKKLLKELLLEWSLKKVEFDEWISLSKQNQNPFPLIQSWNYGSARYEGKQKKMNYYAIHCNGKAVGVVQVAKINLLGKLFGIARINRGPVVFSAGIANDNSSDYSMAIAFLCGQKFDFRHRILSIAPQLSSNRMLQQFLLQIGLNQLPLEPYKTGILSLEKSEEELFSGLSIKWRNMLRKALKSNILIREENPSAAIVSELISIYERYQANKNFKGVPSYLIQNISKQNGTEFEFSIFNAYHEYVHIGVLVAASSNKTTTYLIGISTEVGRSKQVNTLLLWNAIVRAKKTGNKWFDLGGLNSKKISHFKQGVNSRLINCPGEWVQFA
jgi:lipid II:glycine glycyltransferase (peptidoglycan interpeptide bridge formation enzyme)